jgi:hypothetical protein
MKFRSTAVFFLLLIVITTIGYIFWQQELRYALPTPVPSSYVAVQIKQQVSLPSTISSLKKSVYLHFYNPDCPCSLFNAKHVRELIFSHGDSIAAFVVVPSSVDVKAARKEFGDHLKILVDADQLLAKSCGVYSTPQAVILDTEGKLYYRGNYNRARYCTAQATNYAELALLAIINGAAPPTFDLLASRSYGCELPTGKVENSMSMFKF